MFLSFRVLPCNPWVLYAVCVHADTPVKHSFPVIADTEDLMLCNLPESR